MTRDVIVDLLIDTNETLSAAIVIITLSILLYNLTRNIYDRVNRASSILLGCVMVAYLADSFIGLAPSASILEAWFRWQWVGVAFVPAALFHLSDALLATTGRVSRRKRRIASRILYVVGGCFVVLALFSDLLIKDLQGDPIVYMSPGDVFPIYLLYFVLALAGAMFNIVRAWRRCLTRHTRRRMTYLLSVFPTPALGIFPYSLVLSLFISDINAVPEGWLWLVFNIANLAILAMIVFMAYPLAFYGSYEPDRVIRARFLEFMIRGPLIGVAVIFVIESLPRFTHRFGLPFIEILPFAVVGVMLFLHWMATLLIPALERVLVYASDQDQARLLRQISDNLLTKTDSLQLQEALLAAICDQLQVPSAFVASIQPDGKARLEQVIGYIPGENGDTPVATPPTSAKGASSQFTARVPAHEFADIEFDLDMQNILQVGEFFHWGAFWLKPLHLPNKLVTEEIPLNQQALLGVLGIWSDTPNLDLSPEQRRIFDILVLRISYILMDMRMQARLLASLQELVETTTIQSQIATPTPVSPYGQLALPATEATPVIQTTVNGSVVHDPEFNEYVKDALRDYWGGPKLSGSQLLHLHMVNQAAEDEEGNRVRALRRILNEAIESLRPPGQQNLTTTEWILYNILEMRFLQGRKVKEVARRLAMSTSDFYRKQRIAIEEVARIIAETELQILEQANLTEAISQDKNPDETPA
jgi:hypothetical protein